MKVSELLRYLKKNGCVFKRNGSEHEIWINPKTGGEAQIPRHRAKELKTGTAKRILRDLGLDGKG
ncbi:MAG: type II toxin-antitoxin system HicA family toxin [Oscillospiraceae bacterium]|jgi:predicted RNA binding protein YcfA (HicA-like mRNA interferase family)|nr:type II toxin-antitoxin system HicA family toxin [Oscillospiraceae bacterium]